MRLKKGKQMERGSHQMTTATRTARGIAVAISVCLALVVASCQSATPAAPGAQASQTAVQQPLVIVQGYLPKAIDPAFDTGLFTMSTYSYIFDTLVKTDDSGQLLPNLATSWRTVDPKTWEFKIRSGVKFHNGEVFDAAAAKYTIDRINDPDLKSPWRGGRLGAISGVEAPSADTLVIKTSVPSVVIPSGLTTIYMVPPKHVTQSGAVGFGKAPIGTGPFRVTEWVVDDHLTLERNPDYWGGAPKLSKVTIRMVPEEAPRIAALQAGEAQVAFPLSPELVSSVTAKPDLKVAQVILGQSLVIAMRAVNSGPLEKKQVRQALNYAIDKQKIFSTLMQSQGRLLDGQLGGPNTYGYNPDLKAYPYDVQKAKQLLADAGYPNGFEVKFQGPVGRYPQDQQIGEVIAAQLAAVGVKTRYEVIEAGKFSATAADGTIGPLFLWGWNLAPAMAVDQVFPFHVSGHPRKLLADPEFDRIYKQSETEFDASKRLALLQQADTVYRDLAPSIFLWQLPMPIGFNAKVQGFVAHPDATMDLRTMTYVK